MMIDNIILELVEWLCIDLSLAWLGVWTLVEPIKLSFLSKFFLASNGKVIETLAVRGQLGG